MTKSQDDAAHIVLAQIIQRTPSGLGIRDITEAYAAVATTPATERTIRRRLSEMLQLGIIQKRGRARATLYHARSEPDRGDGPPPETEPYVRLSTAGEQTRTLVRAPMIHRRPVGYQEQFLDDYRPGSTWYLPEALRTRLHDLGRTPEQSRPAGTYARDIFERLLIDLAWASSKLEGNTYSRLDTHNLLEHGIRAEGTDADEAQMLLNHKKAIEFLVEEAENIAFNRATLFNIHAALSEGLMRNPRDEGALRTIIVGVTGTTFVPLSIPQRIEEHFDVILAKAADIPDPFEQSFFMMVHIPYLQPFADVNKRTSRLAANIPLVKQNLCPLSFVDVPERAYVEGTIAVYEFNRVELLRDVYAWAYERSCEQYHVVQQSVVQPDPIRLRYRQQINDTIREMVVNGESPVRSRIDQRASKHEIPAADRGAFVEITLELMIYLHEGAIYRFGIRPSEFLGWKSQITRGA